MRCCDFHRRPGVQTHLIYLYHTPPWIGNTPLSPIQFEICCVSNITIHFMRHCVKCVQIRNFFWSVFSRIRTEYGEILRISPYSVRMRKNTDQKKLLIWTYFTQWDFPKRNNLKYKKLGKYMQYCTRLICDN